MELILWRHAEAEDGDGTLPDGKRRLTARGEKQARKVARWLQQHLPRRVVDDTQVGMRFNRRAVRPQLRLDLQVAHAKRRRPDWLLSTSRCDRLHEFEL